MQKSRKNQLAEEDETGSSDDDDSEASKEIKSELHYNLKKPKCKLFYFYQFSWAFLICFSYFVFVYKLYKLPLGEAGDFWRLQIKVFLRIHF
jgi:hypothetical protein